VLLVLGHERMAGQVRSILIIYGNKELGKQFQHTRVFYKNGNTVNLNFGWCSESYCIFDPPERP
jgi:hypothetical protein